MLADAGIGASVLIANQVIGAPKLERLAALAGRLPELIVAVDHPDQVAALESAVSGTGARLGALIEVDSGMHRCGTRSTDETLVLARRLAEGSIEYRGVMGYEGHAVLVADAAKRKSLAEAALAELRRHVEALGDAGLPPEIVSAGGTGTHDITGEAPFVTEIQAGSYVFMDGTYRKVRGEFECALSVVTTIVHVRDRPDNPSHSMRTRE